MSTTAKKRTKANPDDPILCPFTVAIDQREQAPWSFLGLKADANSQRRPLVVPIEVKYLQTGDYSILGWEDRISIERKSLEDLYGTLTAGRERFERELQRLQEMEYAAVVVEAGLGTIVESPPQRSKVNPKTITRSIIAFQQRYFKVHWNLCPDRRFAEIWAFQTLRRFHQDRQQGGCFFHGEDAQAHS